MINVKNAIIEKLKEISLPSNLGVDFDYISEEFSYLSDMEITEEQFQEFLNGKYAYESNPVHGNNLSDAWDLFDDIATDLRNYYTTK